jgi:hypothetical protein
LASPSEYDQRRPSHRQAGATSFHRVFSPSAYQAAEVHHPGLPRTRFVPLSVFLTPSGGYSLRRSTGLFHPAAAHGFSVYRALLRPEIRYLFRGPILPCRYRPTSRCRARRPGVGRCTDVWCRSGDRRLLPKERHDQAPGARLRRVIPSGQPPLVNGPKAENAGCALLTLHGPLKRSPPPPGHRLPGTSRHDLPPGATRR